MNGTICVFCLSVFVLIHIFSACFGRLGDNSKPFLFETLGRKCRVIYKILHRATYVAATCAYILYMKKIRIGDLKRHIRFFDKANIPLMVYGSFGIGKSQIVRESAIDKAESMPSRKFLNWMSASNEEKSDAIENPSKYFAFIDIRLSQLEPSDIRGIPNIFGHGENPCLQTIPWSWIVYICRDGASGTLFLDEINLAAPQIAASAYQVINDRIISDRRISSGVNIVAAGNSLRDTDIIYEMPNPLKDRFAEIEVEFNAEDWLKNWAVQNCHPYVYAFCSFKSEWIHHTFPKGEEKNITPRGIERVSTILKSADINSRDQLSPFIVDLIGASVGESWALQFKAYMSIYERINFKFLISNPESLLDKSSFNTERLYAVMGGLVERFSRIFRTSTDSNIEKIADMCALMRVAAYLPTNLFVLAFRQIKAIDESTVMDVLETDSKTRKIIGERHGGIIADVN